MFIIADLPFVVGVSATKVTTSVGIDLWRDWPIKITEIPSFLQGSVLFQVPHSGIASGTTIKVEGNKKSSVYIALDVDNGRDGGLAGTLSQQGWTLLEGEVGYTGHDGTSYRLSEIWRKILMAKTFVSFTTTTGGQTNSIYVGKIVLITILLLLFTKRNKMDYCFCKLNKSDAIINS